MTFLYRSTYEMDYNTAAWLEEARKLADNMKSFPSIHEIRFEDAKARKLIRSQEEYKQQQQLTNNATDSDDLIRKQVAKRKKCFREIDLCRRSAEWTNIAPMGYSSNPLPPLPQEDEILRDLIRKEEEAMRCARQTAEKPPKREILCKKLYGFVKKEENEEKRREIAEDIKKDLYSIAKKGGFHRRHYPELIRIKNWWEK